MSTFIPPAAQLPRATVVLPPDLTFRELDSILVRLGWQRRRDDAMPEPIVPGEPELAGWGRADRSLIYGANPLLGLRTLSIGARSVGSWPSDVLNELRILSVSDVEMLLTESTPERLLLGILAAREIGSPELLPSLTPLVSHADLSVAREAKLTVASMVPAAAELGAEWLRAQRARRPGESVLFSALPDARQRLQILRWLIQERVAPKDPVLEILRSGLRDLDWEVRLTAMLAAARVHATPLRSEVRQVMVPKGTAEGLDRIDRDALVAARELCVLHLDGRLDDPDASTLKPPLGPALRHLARCILGLPVERHDRIFLLVHALMRPVPDHTSVPTELPPGVVPGPTEGVYVLRGSGIAALELVWIPPVPHWLGDEPAGGSVASPIREVHPESGFLIARRPLTGALTGSGAGDGLDLRTRSGAVDLCESLARQTGIAFALPDADQLEMALRGPDGRRFPWGMGNLDKGKGSTLSPWGADGNLGGQMEWTESVDQESGRTVIGLSSPPYRCSARDLAGPGTLAAVRPVVRLP